MTETLAIGERKRLYANPKDVSGGLSAAPPDLTMTSSDTTVVQCPYGGGFVDLNPLKAGTAIVTWKGTTPGGVLKTYDINVVVTPGAFDHFDPTSDPARPA